MSDDRSMGPAWYDVLKRCPNRKCRGRHAEPFEDRHGEFYILCRDCIMRGPESGTVEEAVAAWNDDLPRDAEAEESDDEQ